MKAKTGKNPQNRMARTRFQPRVVPGGRKRKLSHSTRRISARRAAYLPRRARRGA